MTIEQKLQIEFLKGNALFYKKYDEIVFVCNGHVGCYLKENDLKIDLTKAKEMGETNLSPTDVMKKTIPANKTNNCVIFRKNDYARKLKSDDGKSTFVDVKYLSLFGDFIDVRISENPKEMIAVTKNGKIYGVIMPVNICCDIE